MGEQAAVRASEREPGLGRAADVYQLLTLSQNQQVGGQEVTPRLTAAPSLSHHTRHF